MVKDTIRKWTVLVKFYRVILEINPKSRINLPNHQTRPNCFCRTGKTFSNYTLKRNRKFFKKVFFLPFHGLYRAHWQWRGARAVVAIVLLTLIEPGWSWKCLKFLKTRTTYLHRGSKPIGRFFFSLCRFEWRILVVKGEPNSSINRVKLSCLKLNQINNVGKLIL